MQISGKRLILSDIRMQDRDALIYWLHPDHEWHQLNGPYYTPTPSEEIPDAVDRWLSSELPDFRRRFVILDGETDDVLGMVTRYWISQETHWTAIGISIYDADQWGKGLGYEAFGLWCEYLFATYPDFVRLDLRTWSGNFGMMKLAKKLGFIQEAVFRKARIVNNAYYDSLGYGILRDEWEHLYADGFINSLT